MRISQRHSANKKTALIAATFLALALMVSACSPSNTGSSATPTAPQPTTAPQETSDPTVEAAVSMIADQYQIDSNMISLEEKLPVAWPDSCLGLQQPGIMCAMHVVDGYRITLSANQETYEVHTNMDGSQAVLVPGPVPVPSGVSFTKTGDNSCQTFIFSEKLDISYGQCGAELTTVNLANDVRTIELQHYLSTFGPFMFNSPDGFVNFGGTGSQQATIPEQQSILNWAELTFNEIQSGTEITSDMNDGLLLTWHREGGLAGFCEDLTVYSTGKAVATSCKNDDPKLIGEGWLNSDQLAQLFQWQSTLAWFDYSSDTTATANGLQVTLTFTGTGDTVTTDDQEAVASFAQDLFNQISELNAELPNIQSEM